MYPLSYQDGVDRNILPDVTKKMPGLRFSYAHQFDLIRKYSKANELLDHGCGTGHFVANAVNAGFVCSGTEFNAEQVERLAKEIPSSTFYTIEKFLAGEKKFPVIRMSNVLEHLTDPAGTLDALREKLAPDGLLLVEGPLENNFSPALCLRKLYFLSKHYTRPSFSFSDPPRHIFYSDRHNQRDLFAKAGFEELHFALKECAWPYPEKWSKCKSAGLKLKFLFAKCSMGISFLNPYWGNTFLYLGRKKAQR